MPGYVNFIIMIISLSFTLFVVLAMMLIIVRWRDDIVKNREKEESELAKIIVEKANRQKELARLNSQIKKLKNENDKLGDINQKLEDEVKSVKKKNNVKS